MLHQNCFSTVVSGRANKIEYTEDLICIILEFWLWRISLVLVLQGASQVVWCMAVTELHGISLDCL
jgi:hypothetical protein